MTSQGAKTHLIVKDRQSIIEKARLRKHGKWIERILIQCRKMLTGVGFKEFKDISEQVRNLPKLTGQGRALSRLATRRRQADCRQ